MYFEIVHLKMTEAEPNLLCLSFGNDRFWYPSFEVLINFDTIECS